MLLIVLPVIPSVGILLLVIIVRHGGHVLLCMGARAETKDRSGTAPGVGCLLHEFQANAMPTCARAIKKTPRPFVAERWCLRYLCVRTPSGRDGQTRPRAARGLGKIVSLCL
jgi:hypothetical protein